MSAFNTSQSVMVNLIKGVDPLFQEKSDFVLKYSSAIRSDFMAKKTQKTGLRAPLNF